VRKPGAARRAHQPPGVRVRRRITLNAMYSFQPEPEPAERDALELALDHLLGAELEEPGVYQSEWRHAALEEGVSGGDENNAVL
jgi:hypothetical protein